MIETEETIAYCHACGLPMDVTAVAPFSNVECPGCGKHTRVKREFGPYTLMKRHAAGGMSMVFSANDNTLDREVAVKILSEEYSADERRIESFEQEARLTASLSHPHIVKVYTTGRAFGRFYIAMEFVPGGHFEHQIRERGKIPEMEMLKIAIEVAQGLKAAQSAGLIHRDVKPGNILLDAEGHAKLVDFGLALVTQGGTATATELWATPYYVPPETVEGQAEDFRSDMYAFGATLYHALAGIPPCNEESMASDVLREAKRRIIPLAQADASISAETCRIVDRAMAYLPEQRFSSYNEMITAMQHSLAHLKHGRGELNAAARRALKKRRERQWQVIAAAGFGILVVTVAATLWFRQKSAPSRPSHPAVNLSPPSENSANPSQQTAPHDGNAEEIARNYRQARESLESGDYESASKAFLALLKNPAVQEPTRSWAGIEAVITGFLDGKTQDARRNARETLKHLRSLPTEAQLLPNSLNDLLERLNGPRPIPANRIGPAEPGAPRLAALMLASLKSWEQGMFAQAANGFREAVEMQLPPDQTWAATYQKLAANYLSDHNLLQSQWFETLPATADACDLAIDELNLIQASIKTRGRARYNVRSWQQELAAQRNRIIRKAESGNDGTTPQRIPKISEIMAQIHGFARDCRHSEACEFLEKLPSSDLDAARNALHALAKSAADFVSELESQLAKTPVQAEITLRNGEEVIAARLDESDGLTVTTSSGKSMPVRWGDLYPDAPILFHQKLLNNYSGDDAQRLRRNEGAIAHLWLNGERERATTAAAKLSSGNPDFAARWEKILRDLPK